MHDVPFLLRLYPLYSLIPLLQLFSRLVISIYYRRYTYMATPANMTTLHDYHPSPIYIGVLPT